MLGGQVRPPEGLPPNSDGPPPGHIGPTFVVSPPSSSAQSNTSLDDLHFEGVCLVFFFFLFFFLTWVSGSKYWFIHLLFHLYFYE
jgi:hypothetical protein